MKSNKTWHVRATIEENNYNHTRERETEKERESQLTCAIDNRSKETRERTLASEKFSIKLKKRVRIEGRGRVLS